MAADEQDACNICEGDKSTTKNPIIFCDGKGCNLPVHKICYNVQEVPEDDWYCQRCENKKRKKATIIVCCPIQTGAVKKTTTAGEYMHVVCAMWNKNIKNEIEPYPVTKTLLDKDTCHYCSQKKGVCIRCEEPNCTTRFHATCGINNSVIPPSSSVPANFIAKCSDHLTVRYRKKAPKGKRRLRRNDSEDDSEDEEDDEEEDSDEEEEEEDDEEDESEDERQKIIRKTHKTKSVSAIPTKRRASPQSLFPEDQHSSDDNKQDNDNHGNDDDDDDDDDDMGTASSAKSKFNLFGNKSSHSNINNHSSMHVTPSYKERLEAKRKKSALESRPSLSDDRRPLTATPPPLVTPKQKLPNRAHLASSSSNNNTMTGTRPGSTPPTLTKRFSTGPGIIKSIDELQRWNAPSTNTTLQHPQPTTPNAIPTTSFFENEIRNTGQRKPMDWKSMNVEKEELARVKEENRRLTEFKRAVSEVLSALNVPVPAGTTPDVDHVESYVAQLQTILRRVGPIREQERIQIQECVKSVGHNNTNQ
ncbi:hypothetical protein INT47_006969 [Mucor saturninus]|uniref:PHD-type domain-containing protein n=1 Tax=Mucor saturninus TaxID=64648 RepID=A0A8H7QKP6_9FUNG|nr:hypothetical protein INT47_006969 [Mucor saturninus]